jgi:hypothetical protein
MNGERCDYPMKSGVDCVQGCNSGSTGEACLDRVTFHPLPLCRISEMWELNNWLPYFGA